MLPPGSQHVKDRRILTRVDPIHILAVERQLQSVRDGGESIDLVPDDEYALS